MAETRRFTEGEAKSLMRDAAQQMRDEDAIHAYLTTRGARLTGRGLVPIVLVVSLIGLPLLDRSVPLLVWAMIAGLLAAVFGQATEIKRLSKVVSALARTVERARFDPPA
jgi:hypothetical protein